ncbi:MAG TPA: hypothetical protein VH592_25385 [Gemmataceae bacterium]|jgi:hypothetical protein
MIPTVRGWLVVAAIAALAGLHPQPGRADDTPPADLSSGTLPTPTTVAPPQPPAYVLPPPSWPTYTFDKPDPLLDRPYGAQPGWYTNVETNFLLVHLRNQLGAPVTNTLTGNTDTVMFAGNPINPTVSPRFEVGYRFPSNWGGIQLGYRFLTSQGSDFTTTGPEDDIQAPAHQVGILNFNLIDLAYVSREYSLGPYWNMRWGAGARMLFLYFNSGLRFLNPGSALGDIVAQNSSNSVSGAGVWAFGDLERKMPIPGMALFGRFEATDLETQVRQGYSETVAGGNGSLLAFNSRFAFSAGVPILREVAGISYTVPEWNYSRFMLGVQWETFFQIGRLSLTNGFVDTRGQLDLYGIFFRAEFNF